MKLDPVAGYVVKTTTIMGERTKVFINACSDAQIPEPDTLDPAEIIQRLQRNEDWIVPIVVSPERKDFDKAGKESLVFDCCMNPKVLLLGTTDPGVKVLTNETCIELVEDSSGHQLDREYTLPRMKAKGQLYPTQISDNDFKKPKALDEILAEATKPEPALTAAPVKKSIVIEEVSATNYSFGPYRRPYSEQDQAPSHELEYPGGVQEIKMNDTAIVVDDTTIEIGFKPSKLEAIFTKDDDTLHVFFWN